MYSIVSAKSSGLMRSNKFRFSQPYFLNDSKRSYIWPIFSTLSAATCLVFGSSPVLIMASKIIPVVPPIPANSLICSRSHKSPIWPSSVITFRLSMMSIARPLNAAPEPAALVAR